MPPPFLQSVAATRARPWIVSAAVVCTLAVAYHFAEPIHSPGNMFNTAGVHAGIHLENVPFVAYSGQRRAWSLKAKSVDITHSQYSSAATIQSALITSITDGLLFPSDPNGNDGLLPITAQTTDTAGHAKPGKDTPLLTFKAQTGHYFVGSTHPLPPDLAANYTCRWQLQLEGGVAIRTRDGDELKTERLTILGITGISNHKEEQRLECDAGALLSRKDVSINANRLRYALEDHTVELLNGVRLVFKSGTVQSERTFWALHENVIRIPDRCSGTLNGSAFSAAMLTLDLKNETSKATGFWVELSRDSEDLPSLPGTVTPAAIPRRP